VTSTLTQLGTTDLSADLRTSLLAAWRGPETSALVALVDDVDGAATTYAELAELVERRARRLTELGLAPGEVIGVLGEKSTATVSVHLAAIAAGGCPVFLDPRSGDDDVAAQLTQVGSSRVVVLEPGREPALAHVHAIADLDATPAASTALPEIAPSDRAMLLFTSGSTGAPKGIVLTHRNLLTNAAGVVERTGLTRDDTLLHVMPLHHTNGVNNQVIAPLLAGARILLAKRFSPETAIAALRDQRPTYLTGVPTMYLRMLDLVRPGERFPGLRFLRCGSAPITVEQQRAVEECFGVPLVLSYGMSEATCTSTMNPPDAPRAGTVGVALKGQQVRVVVPCTLDDVPVGADGEVVIGGPAVMAGYLSGTILTHPGDLGWLRTGDLGRLDADGYLTISGRLKDTIIRGGENISPVMIERALVGHPAVRDVCVVAQPHPDLGEVPVAFVSLEPGGAVTAEELRSFAAERLPRYCVPAEVTLLAELPTNGVGKHDRRRLKSLAGGSPG